jgi:hypothetical protein
LILNSNHNFWNENVHALHNISSTPGQNNLYDDFEGGTYSLSPGNTSPNGKWYDEYSGFGIAGVSKDLTTGNNFFYEEPKISTSPHETHASLVLTTTKNYSNFDMTLDMVTFSQLRQTSPPNPWETAWIYWHYTDEFHWYAIYLKPTGFQIEKKDNDNHVDSAEIYLSSGQSPKLTLGQWNTIRINMVDNHITVWVDGHKIADFRDRIPNSTQMSYGSMGLYNEDSRAGFDNVYIARLK